MGVSSKTTKRTKRLSFPLETAKSFVVGELVENNIKDGHAPISLTKMWSYQGVSARLVEQIHPE